MTKIKGVYLPAHAIEQAKLVEVDTHDLKDAQDLIGGWIEFVTTHLWMIEQKYGSIKLLVDEEGRLKGHPLNVRASTFYAGPGIYGPAIIVGYDHHDSEYPMRDISDQWIGHCREAERRIDEVMKASPIKRTGVPL